MNLYHIITGLSLILPIPIGIYAGKAFFGIDFPLFLGLVIQAIVGNIILVYVRGYEHNRLGQVYIGYLLFFADRTPSKGPLHTNFSLKEKTGDLLELYDELSGTLLDSIEFGPQAPTIAYARKPDGGATWQETTCVSPGKSNGACGVSVLVTYYLPLIQK